MRRIDGSNRDPYVITEDLFRAYVSARDSDLCPCGSGKPFRACHKLRKRDSKTRLDEIDRILLKRNKKRRCFAEDATCSKVQAFSHSIPRNSLETIAENGHVMQFRMPSISEVKKLTGYADIDPSPVGINEACCFYGFCADHDNSLFAPVEKQQIEPTPEQSTLLYFRALCRELSSKTDIRPFLGAAKSLLEERDDAETAHTMNLEIIQHQIGSERAVAELLRYHERTLRDIRERSYSRIGSMAFRTGDPLAFNACLFLNPTYDLRGRRIQDLDNLSVDTEYLSVTCLNDSKGGIVCLNWPIDSVLDSYFDMLKELGDRTMDFVLQFIFAYCESHAFRPSWWNSLSLLQKRRLKTIYFHNIEDIQTGENPLDLFRYMHYLPPSSFILEGAS